MITLVAGRFQLLDEIGRGTTGTVFKARDEQSGDIVALKILAEDIKDPERELLLARQVTNLYVCRVYDIFPHDGPHDGPNGGRKCYSMEFVDGKSLQSLIENFGPLPFEKVMLMAGQIIEGLGAAHSKGIVHRDLKPANILVANDGTIKITDFGLARIPNPEATATISGTPAYMSPEQLAGKMLDGRSDIYTLGCTLYEMLSGKRPSRQFPAPLGGSVPAFAQSAIFRCLEEDRDRRFPNVGELRTALSGRSSHRTVHWATALLIITTIGLASLPSADSPPPAQPLRTAASPPLAPTVKKNLPTIAVLVDPGFRDLFAEALAANGKYQVVEREKTDGLKDELQIGGTFGLKPGSEPKIGKLVGAKYLMFGSKIITNGKLYLTARIILTEDGTFVVGRSVDGDPKDLRSLVQSLAKMF